MAVFSYIARDTKGQKVEGVLSANSQQALLAELQTRNLAPVTVHEVREARRFERGVSISVLAGFYRQLSDLLRAGVPLLRALRLLGRSKANPHLARIVSKVADDVAEGERLADAMLKHQHVFAPIHVAMVRAGERGGFLEPVLMRLAKFLEHQADLRAKVVGNLAYPVILLIVMVTVVVVGLVFFVPQFEEFFANMELPWATRTLLAGSDMLTTYWWALLLAIAALIAVGWWVCRREVVRKVLARWQLHIPKYGELVRNLAIARFCRILGTMLDNGIPLLTAMQIARDAAGNILMAEAIDRATESVREGESLADPLRQSGLITDDVIEMIAVGESANNLPEVLTTIADTIESRVNRLLDLLVRLMEPVMLVVFGTMVFFLFVALALPMMRMSASM